MGILTIRTVTEELRMRYKELRISITDKICKAFTKKSSSLIFPWCPHGHMASVAEATRTLRMLRMAERSEKMIRKSLNIFQIRKPATLQRYIQPCGVLGVYLCDDLWDFHAIKISTSCKDFLQINCQCELYLINFNLYISEF